MKSDRREFITGLTAFLGAGVLSQVNSNAVLAGLNFNPQGKPVALTAELFEVAGIVVDIILPRTETPGATDAGVHEYMDHMVAHWMTDAEAKSFKAGLEQISRDAKIAYGKPFLAASAEQQLKLVKAMDAQGWGHPFFPTFKSYTVVGYFTSEVGATEALEYDPVPGPYQDMLLSETGRAWAT